MSDLLNALKAAVVTAELDLGELDPIYEGVKLSYRVNWTQAMKRTRWKLIVTTQELKNQEGTDDATWEANAQKWHEWWANILLMTPDEVTELSQGLPAAHWIWIGRSIVTAAVSWEEAETKKVNVLHLASSEEKAIDRPTSTGESG